MPCELVKQHAAKAIHRMQKNKAGVDLVVNYVDIDGELTESQFNQAVKRVEKQLPARPAPVVKRTQVAVAAPVTVPAGTSKAQQVRAFIAAAKAANSTAVAVIDQAMNKLAMTRSQATKYVQENWARA